MTVTDAMDDLRNGPENVPSMFLALFHELRKLDGRIVALETRWRELDDRVGVIETNTIDHESRLQELEES
jgi:predicted nuclease with TOPRIM domain